MKIRAILNGFSFDTTSAAIKRGWRDDLATNEALQGVLAMMGKDEVSRRTVVTFVHPFTNVETKFDIQLRVM